jgi:hypothetical protein
MQGFDKANPSAFQKERMKSGNHNLAKLNAGIAADFGRSVFGILCEMANTHSKIVRIFQEKETEHWCIAILKTPSDVKVSHMEQVGQKMGFSEKRGSRPYKINNFLKSLGFDCHPNCAIGLTGSAPKGFPENPVR